MSLLSIAGSLRSFSMTAVTMVKLREGLHVAFTAIAVQFVYHFACLLGCL